MTEPAVDPPRGRRARSLAEFAALQARIGMREMAAQSIAAWKPRPTDIVITPYGKCGTTWLQHMFHTLRTRGDLEFDDISAVVPWIETSAMLGIDLEAPQKAEPRGFKSHLPADRLPRGSKAIVSFRDPRDAFLSHFHFMQGWFLEPGAVPLADYVRGARIAARGQGLDYWRHLLSWWERRTDPDVLLLSYEHMVEDPETAIRAVAAFCGIPLDGALLALTRERTSLAFMLAQKEKFDDLLMRRLSEEKGGLPPGSDSAKVRAGKVGGHRAEMPPDLAAELDAVWAETVMPATGFADYDAFDAAVRAL